MIKTTNTQKFDQMIIINLIKCDISIKPYHNLILNF